MAHCNSNSGECWGGLTADEEYDKNGEGGACFGPEFGACKEDDINCVGAITQEFVYEIGMSVEFC